MSVCYESQLEAVAEASIANVVQNIEGLEGSLVFTVARNGVLPGDVPCPNLVTLGVTFSPRPSCCRAVFASLLPAQAAQFACSDHSVCRLEGKPRYNHVGLFVVVSSVLWSTRFAFSWLDRLSSGHQSCCLLMTFLPFSFLLGPLALPVGTKAAIQPCWPFRGCILCAVVNQVCLFVVGSSVLWSSKLLFVDDVFAFLLPARAAQFAWWQ